MSSRGLLIAAIVLTVLAGLVYWSKDRAPEPAEGASPKLVNIKEEDVNRIEIRRKDQPPVILERGKTDDWRITSPEPLRADADAARSVATALSGLAWEELVDENGTNPGQFGLAAPQLEIRVAGRGTGSQTLQLGDDVPTTGGFYARMTGNPRIFTVTSSTKAALDKAAGDLRDKRLLIFDEDKLARIELASGGRTLELTKSGDNWQITKPAAVRADNGQVDELIQKLRTARLEEPYAGSGFRSGTVRVTDASGTQQLEIFKSGEDHFAVSSVVPGKFKVAADTASAIEKNFADLRNKKVFDFGFNDPTRIAVKAGDQSWTFEKRGEDWHAAGKKVDSVAVQRLIDKLRDLSATAFPSYGGSQPAMEITVTAKKPETVTITNTNIARREGEPALYQLDPKAVEEIRTAASDVK